MQRIDFRSPSEADMSRVLRKIIEAREAAVKALAHAKDSERRIKSAKGEKR